MWRMCLISDKDSIISSKTNNDKKVRKMRIDDVVYDMDELREKYNHLLSIYDSYPVIEEEQILDVNDVKKIIEIDTSPIKIVITNTPLQERMKLMIPNPDMNV